MSLRNTILSGWGKDACSVKEVWLVAHSPAIINQRCVAQVFSLWCFVKARRLYVTRIGDTRTCSAATYINLAISRT
jgi:hypothetical protein